jgi:hypothetical protein
MILYFPVSALVTLFANIVNNPLDPRAKSDSRLMNLVVTFLSMLGQEAEYGGVHRMLGICTEFERIAKAVIEKAEKDQSSRRKRKNAEAVNKASSTPKPSNVAAGNRMQGVSSSLSPPQTTGYVGSPSGRNSGPTTPSQLPGTVPMSSPMGQADRGQSYSPMAGSFHTDSQSPPQQQGHHQRRPAPLGPSDWSQDFPMAHNGEFESYSGADVDSLSNGSPSSIVTAFQQPLLPQELFNLPMNLDWNWAEVSGAAYPSVENGNFGDMDMMGQQHQHQQHHQQY